MKETLQPKLQRQLGLGLLTLRLSIALVFIMWALDKVLVPEHAMKVFSGFYGLDISSGFSVALGIARRLDLFFFCEVPRPVQQPIVLRGVADACCVFRSLPIARSRHLCVEKTASSSYGLTHH